MLVQSVVYTESMKSEMKQSDRQSQKESEKVSQKQACTKSAEINGIQ